jgi:nucleotide-binding universal stress UspA family protein
VSLKILVTLDGSPVSERILPSARRIAERAGADVYLLRVIRTPRTAGATAPAAGSTAEILLQDPEQAEAEARAYLEPLCERFPDTRVECLVRSGPYPDEVILGCAEELGVDMIAMATHGRGGMGEELTGGIAGAVVRAGSVPVMLFRPTVRSDRPESQG